MRRGSLEISINPKVCAAALWSAAKYAIKQFGNFLVISNFLNFVSTIVYADKISRILHLEKKNYISRTRKKLII